MVGSCHGGQLSPWAVVMVGSCRWWAVVHGGQLSPVGSCPVGQLSGGEMSPGAAVGWGDVGASKIALRFSLHILDFNCDFEVSRCKILFLSSNH